jgi:hypothetical protein
VQHVCPQSLHLARARAAAAHGRDGVRRTGADQDANPASPGAAFGPAIFLSAANSWEVRDFTLSDSALDERLVAHPPLLCYPYVVTREHAWLFGCSRVLASSEVPPGDAASEE